MSEDAVKWFTFVVENWTFFLFLLTVVAVAGGYFVAGLNPFFWIGELVHKQKEYRRKDRQEEIKTLMVQSLTQLGDDLLDVGEVGEARAAFEKALALDPLDRAAYLGLFKADVSLSLQAASNSQVAEKQLALILRHDPEDKHALLWLGDQFARTGDEEDRRRAKAYYERAIRRDPRMPITFNNLGYLLDESGKPEEALANYQKAADLADRNTTMVGNAAYHLLRKKQYDEAIRRFERLRRLDPRMLWPYWSLAQAYLLVGNPPPAHDLQRQASRLLEDDEVMSLPVNRGELLFYAGTEPVKLFTQPEKRCYSDYRTALAFELTGRPDLADVFVQKARSGEPGDRVVPEKLFLADVAELRRERAEYRDALQGFIARHFTAQGEPPAPGADR
jgi:tetratricopeptide (TPR) repeat protein